MRIALVHELLTMKGGAERVLKIVSEMFPDAPIYTLLYNEKKLGDWFPAHRTRSSILQPSRLMTHDFAFNHHRFLNSFPRAVEAWNFNEFDLVLSFSSAFAHGIITNGKPKHLSYIHSPARYLWDQTHAVQERANPLVRPYLSKTFHKLRIWDSEAAARPDMLLAASNEVQRRIQLYWDRESDVVYPPIDDSFFVSPPPSGEKSPGHFLIVSTLARYKQIDLAITACNQTGAQLKIVGDGPDRRRLERLAGPAVEFLGYVQGQELRHLYAGAKAVIFPGLEDFGLVPVEANACGTPVIAYRGGGVLETQIEGVTAAYFDEQNAGSLAGILRSFDHKKYSSEKCQTNAERFRQSHFEQQLHTKISQLMAN
jgi:glycosyltransferase involved in cell wall biosynthesis